MTNQSVPSLGVRRDGIDARRQTLESRLDDGYRRIDQALHAGEDVRAWEDFWIRLLHEYEAVCDERHEFGSEDLAA